MNKICGKQEDFSIFRVDGSRIVIGYGLKEAENDLYEWYEVYFYKKQKNTLSLQDVKDAIVADINARITNQIVGGFKWQDKPVWYSLENQINFSQSAAPCSIKIGEYEDGSPVYVEFASSEVLKAFNDACLAWKNQCLEAGRAEKENIDWTPYEELFPQDEPDIEPES